MSLLWIIPSTLAALALLYAVISYFTFCFAFRRNKKQGRARDLSKNKSVTHFSDRIAAGIADADSRPYEKVAIRSHDGLRLAARLYACEAPRATVILFHGYRSFPSLDFGSVFVHYIDECHFRVLMVDERAHEESEGKYITFGILERQDCLAWCRYAADRFGGRIILDGMSMGATTVLMASALPLPENVTGIIADSGYSSVEEILRHVGRTLRLPVGFLLPGVFFFCRTIAHFDPRATTAPLALQQNTRPLLIIHGEADGFVPFAMGKKNAAALPPEMFLAVPGADHGLGYLVDKEAVTAAVDRLFAMALAHEWPPARQN